MERYAHMSDQRLYQEFVKNTAEIRIEGETIHVLLKKKRALPLVIEKLSGFKELQYPWLDNKKFSFDGATYS
jgi:hypothetical protein